MVASWLTDTVTADLDRGLHYTALWGFDAVELRMIGRERVPYANERKLRRRLEEFEMPVAALVPGVFEGPASDRAMGLNDVATLAETLAFAGRIGCAVVVASAFAAEDAFDAGAAADVLRRAGDAAGRAGVQLALLNETGMQHATGAALAGLLAAVDHPAVGAAWSPSDALQAGEAAADGLEALAGRVVHVRARDGAVGDAGWVDAGFGEGALGWPAILRGLHGQSYAGAISLEIHPVADVPRAKLGLRSGTALVQAIRAARR